MLFDGKLFLHQVSYFLKPIIILFWRGKTVITFVTDNKSDHRI